MKVGTLMIQHNLISLGLRWYKGYLIWKHGLGYWVWIILKSTVIPQSSMFLLRVQYSTDHWQGCYQTTVFVFFADSYEILPPLSQVFLLLSAKRWWARGSPRRYVLKIHFFIEFGLKMIQFKIQFKTKSGIFISKKYSFNGVQNIQ